MVARNEKINVTAVFAAFETPNYKRKITPLRFVGRDGIVHQVAAVRRSYTDHVGDTCHVHFVVATSDDRYFDIVYDTQRTLWLLVIELDDTLHLRQ